MFNKRKLRNLQKSARSLIAHDNPKSIVSEQFRTIRTGIDFSLPDKELETLLITSSAPGEGKSTVSANTAIVFAQNGKKVLLVDTDMRKPSVHYTFALQNTMGLTDVLAKKMTLQEAVRAIDIENLDILTCGPLPPNPAELLGSKAMEALIEAMKEQYDLIVFDTPPILSVTDGLVLANKCDGVIVVVRSGKTEKTNIVKTKEALLQAKANIFGVVLNDFELTKDHYYYNYYGVDE
ncbi:CpsD/CapB family tyrosine-protein kinase [Sporosarcina sp. OR05]|uniref:CpsD/CapB family tyrosine-protein kinase n=1 Tax=Sporosarcina sp. OR05 TaxID=2969819 RepID=UPI00352ABF6E